MFRLFGFAGTGKTTLARHIAEGIDGEVKYAAFTGKAALVMRNKGCDDASTIHSLIYRTRESDNEQPSFELWDEAPASKAKLIVIDECSMVDAELGRDLLSFGTPLAGARRSRAAAADPGRRLLHQCRARRDADRGAPSGAERSDRAAVDGRARGPRLERGQYGETEVVSRDALDPERVMSADQVLVGRNNTRRAYNMRIREKQDITDPLPVAGDKLVCLRNNRKKALFNGGLWRVKARATSKSRLVTMRLTPDEDVRSKPVKVTVRPECFAGGIEESLGPAQAL